MKIGYFTNGKAWSWVDFEDVLAPCSRLSERLNSWERQKKKLKTCVLRMYLTVTVPPPAISDVSQLKRKHDANPSQEIDLAMAKGIKETSQQTEPVRQVWHSLPPRS